MNSFSSSSSSTNSSSNQNRSLEARDKNMKGDNKEPGHDDGDDMDCDCEDCPDFVSDEVGRGCAHFFEMAV
jgi:hypothetical protein